MDKILKQLPKSLKEKIKDLPYINICLKKWS